LRAELLDVETIIHLAGAEGRGRIRLLHHVDLEGTERLIEESQRAQVKRIIYVSRLNADRASSYPLLRIKGQVERMLMQSGLSYTIIRSANLYGRDDHFFNVIASLAAWTWPLVWLPGGGKVAMQPLWVEDLVRCLVASLDQPGMLNQNTEVAGEERLRYTEVVQLSLEISGLRRVSFGPAIKLVRPLSALLFGWWRRPPVTRFMMDRFTVPEVAPLDSVYRQFGFRPSRMNQRISYLRGSGHRLRLFRLV
jgi:NADH dehydrogenase